MRRFALASESSDNTEEDFPFLHSMLNVANLDQHDALTMAQSVFSDGMTSVGPAMVYLQYLLASNVDKQERLHDEVRSVMKEGSQVTPETLQQVPYAKACIKEMLR